MRNLTRLSAFMLFLSASFFAAAPYSRAQTAGPGQENADRADAYIWDLGMVKSNSVIKRSFYLKNESGRIWHIG
ncbi:MAG: hypothetical protein PHF11_08045, partial [Candidatus Omnitrophica bacterium]|nr:hypothetical protein [Candidatus Omnitrophota bacterium]